MSNWRLDIKKLFENWAVNAIGDNLKKFGSWNNQVQNSSKEETMPSLAVFFEYSEIGDGFEYLNQTNIQKLERVPVEVTLHIVFDSYNDQTQDCAYDYAWKLTCEIVGKKNDLIHGQIMKVKEIEDINHSVKYDYMISFGFFIKEQVAVPDSEKLIDSNPEEEPPPNPDTGRVLNVQLIPKIKK